MYIGQSNSSILDYKPTESWRSLKVWSWTSWNRVESKIANFLTMVRENNWIWVAHSMKAGRECWTSSILRVRLRIHHKSREVDQDPGPSSSNITTTTQPNPSCTDALLPRFLDVLCDAFHLVQDVAFFDVDHMKLWANLQVPSSLSSTNHKSNERNHHCQSQRGVLRERGLLWVTCCRAVYWRCW